MRPSRILVRALLTILKIKSILTLSIAALLLFGCEDIPLKPNVEFDEPIKGRTVNLSNTFGDVFQIRRGNDTINYPIIFDKTNDFNYLIKSDTDTVFAGTVTKRNELYLLNRSLENGKFAIHALKKLQTQQVLDSKLNAYNQP